MKTTHRTKDGTVMLITEMTDSHLQNTIAAKERWWATQMQPYLEEMERRGLKRRSWWKSAWIAIRQKCERKKPQVVVQSQRQSEKLWEEYPFEFGLEHTHDGQDFL